MKKINILLIAASILLISVSIYGYFTDQISLKLLIILALSSALLIYGQLNELKNFSKD
jgi:hypothetical protein